MEPLPAVDEHRIHDARAHLLALQREGADDFLALVPKPALVKAERNVTVELGATR